MPRHLLKNGQHHLHRAGFYLELVKLAKKYGFLVISDFAYADVCYEGYKAPSFLATPSTLAASSRR